VQGALVIGALRRPVCGVYFPTPNHFNKRMIPMHTAKISNAFVNVSEASFSIAALPPVVSKNYDIVTTVLSI
jgi:hypothetical protein